MKLSHLLVAASLSAGVVAAPPADRSERPARRGDHEPSGQRDPANRPVRPLPQRPAPPLIDRERPAPPAPGHRSPHPLPERPLPHGRGDGDTTLPAGPDRGRPAPAPRPIHPDRIDIEIGRIRVGDREVSFQRPDTLPADRREWDAARWGGHGSIWNIQAGNRVNVDIDAEFQRNLNFAFAPRYWGGQPWWACTGRHPWHRGHWHHHAHVHHHYVWHVDDGSFGDGFMWGLAVWTLGNLIYDLGYSHYHNPYPVTVVENTYITYSQPIAVEAAANPPSGRADAEQAGALAFEAAREAFRAGDHALALAKAEEAIGKTPDDPVIHEFRALALFSLERYTEAAGVLHPVLASGPGWGWDTMLSFYPATDRYAAQLRRLEVRAAEDDAAAHRFLMGYHYMVCGHLAQARDQFAKAASLEPGDALSRELVALLDDSLPQEGAPPPPLPDPLTPPQIAGTWVRTSPDGVTTLSLTPEGSFRWSRRDPEGRLSEREGTFGFDDRGLVVWSTSDAQFVSVLRHPDPSTLHFTLFGTSSKDEGITFIRR